MFQLVLTLLLIFVQLLISMLSRRSYSKESPILFANKLRINESVPRYSDERRYWIRKKGIIPVRMVPSGEDLVEGSRKALISHLSPSPARNRACRQASYLPWDKTHRRCPVAGSKGRTRSMSGGRPDPGPYVPPAKVPILGRSPRISFRNACHTNNIQYFHITFTH